MYNLLYNLLIASFILIIPGSCANEVLKDVHRRTSRRLASKHTDKLHIREFWPTHGKGTFGLASHDEMIHVRTTDHSDAFGMKYVRHTQTVKGLKVFGGEVVIVTDRDDHVLRAKGHPLPTSTQAHNADLDAEATISVEDMEARLRVEVLLRSGATIEGSNISTEAAKRVDLTVTSQDIQWYRIGLTAGRPTGKITLAYVVKASAKVDGELAIFDAVVDATSGALISYMNRKEAISASRLKALKRKNKNGSVALHGKSKSNVAMKSQASSASTPDWSDYSMKIYDDAKGKLIWKTKDGNLDDQRDEVILTVEVTTVMANMYKSITGGAVKNFKRKDEITWKASLFMDDENAYYYEDKIVFGDGFVTDDIIAHEWIHGYTEYGPGYHYEYQSGALNEAISDIFGEAVDILNEQFNVDGNMEARKSDRSCNAVHSSPNLPSTDSSMRWLIGEESDYGGLRDMYYPECFGDPGSTMSASYKCFDEHTPEDYGGVHYNSGIPNRVFALLVDGGTFTLTSNDEEVSVNGIGLEKALGLMAVSQEEGIPTDKFVDWGLDLLDICDSFASLENSFYVPNLVDGSSVSGSVVTNSDCDKLRKILDTTGLLADYDDYCPAPDGDTAVADVTAMCELASSDMIEDGRDEYMALTGWKCTNSTTAVQDPCLPGAWTGVYCKDNRVNTIDFTYKWLGGSQLAAGFAGLTGLKTLILPGTGLTGPVPYAFSQSMSLKKIDLRANALSGPIPTGFCDMFESGSLKQLALSDNSFSCTPKCLKAYMKKIDGISHLKTCKHPTAEPTREPTREPTVAPSGPSHSPTPEPTFAPTEYPFPLVTGEMASTASATVNYTSACTLLCKGDEALFDSCGQAETTGDTYMRLVHEASGVEIDDNDDYSYGDRCAAIYVPKVKRRMLHSDGDCNRFCVHVGCWSSTECSAEVRHVLNGHEKTEAGRTPTTAPTKAPTGPLVIADFPMETGSLHDTDDARQNVATGCARVCQGQLASFTTCSSDGVSASDDTKLRLYRQKSDGTMKEIGNEMFECSPGSSISHISETSNKESKPLCETVCVSAGCSGDASCSATVRFFLMGVEQSTEDPPCEDNPSFRYKGKDSKDCDWVGEKPSRCKKAESRQNCPKTCDTCRTEWCEDDEDWRGKKGERCADTKAKTKLCKAMKSRKGVKAKVACPLTCGTCSREDYEDFFDMYDL